jgi:DinB family protein
MRPAIDDYPEYFRGYVSLVPEEDVFAALDPQVALIEGLPARVGAARETFAYAPGKWSVREMLGHITDAERVFAYRALTFSRFDSASLPGFDETTWTPQGHFAGTPLRELSDEFVALRRANLQMLRRLDEPQWRAGGLGSNQPITVRALAFVMAGHVRHHLAILRDRYAIG